MSSPVLLFFPDVVGPLVQELGFLELEGVMAFVGGAEFRLVGGDTLLVVLQLFGQPYAVCLHLFVLFSVLFDLGLSFVDAELERSVSLLLCIQLVERLLGFFHEFLHGVFREDAREVGLVVEEEFRRPDGVFGRHGCHCHGF